MDVYWMLIVALAAVQVSAENGSSRTDVGQRYYGDEDDIAPADVDSCHRHGDDGECAGGCADPDETCGSGIGGNCVCKRGCLHGDNLVWTKASRQKLVRHLEIGDEVLTIDSEGVIKYQPMYLDIHRDPQRAGVRFTEIRTSRNKVVILTPHHLLYLEGLKPVEASGVRIGDELLIHDTDLGAGPILDRVTNISNFIDTGIFNPLVNSGSILAGDILTSNYHHIGPFTDKHLHLGSWFIRIPFNLIGLKSFKQNHINSFVNAFEENAEKYFLYFYDHFTNY